MMRGTGTSMWDEYETAGVTVSAPQEMENAVRAYRNHIEARQRFYGVDVSESIDETKLDLDVDKFITKDDDKL